MAEEKLRNVLALRRAEYGERLPEWNLLADAWSGRGGFLPPLDEASWGTAGPKWSDTTSSRSYIIPFTRERYPHWQQRVRTSCYVNHYRRIAETILGFLRRTPITISDLPPEVEEWRKNADGLGHSLDSMIAGPLAEFLMRFGYCLGAVDRPNIAARDGAEAREPGLSTFASVRDPRSMIAWDVDATGQLAWTRFEERFTRWPDPMSGPDSVVRWTLWTPEEIFVWEWVQDGPNKAEDASLVDGFPRKNPTGRLPVVPVFHNGMRSSFDIVDAPLLSTAMLGHWIFNRSSEETDLYRQRGFPLLCWPVKQGQTPRGIKAGTDNAIPFPAEGNAPMYLQPDGSTAANYDLVIRRGTGDMYEQSRTDFARRMTGQTESAASQQTRFQAMNANLVSFGQSCADAARQMTRLAVLWNAPEGSTVDPDAVLAGAKFEAPYNYDVEDLDRELGQMETGLRLGLGPTAEAALRRQARDRLITLEGDELEASNNEIEAERAARMKREAGGEPTAPAAAADLDATFIPSGESAPDAPAR